MWEMVEWEVVWQLLGGVGIGLIGSIGEVWWH